MKSRWLSYRLIVPSWRPRRLEEDLDVNSRTSRRARKGQEITVEFHKGLLGLPWYSKITPIRPVAGARNSTRRVLVAEGLALSHCAEISLSDNHEPAQIPD